jgi:hypothetical protein
MTDSVRGDVKTTMRDQETPKPDGLCSICSGPVHTNPRYPRLVCNECGDRATDPKSRPVRVFNYGMLGTGVVVKFLDGTLYAPPEIGYAGPDVFIDGIRCTTQEAYFGGIVIQRAER